MRRCLRSGRVSSWLEVIIGVRRKYRGLDYFKNLTSIRPCLKLLSLHVFIIINRVAARYAMLFLCPPIYAHVDTEARARSIFPRRDAPSPDVVADLEPQPLQLPLRVHVPGGSHGLFVPRTDTGGAGVRKVAPYAWSKRVSYRCLCGSSWQNNELHVARFLPFSSGSPNQYLSNPPLLVASTWEYWSRTPRWVRSVV